MKLGKFWQGKFGVFQFDPHVIKSKFQQYSLFGCRCFEKLKLFFGNNNLKWFLPKLFSSFITMAQNLDWAIQALKDIFSASKKTFLLENIFSDSSFPCFSIRTHLRLPRQVQRAFHYSDLKQVFRWQEMMVFNRKNCMTKTIPFKFRPRVFKLVKI